MLSATSTDSFCMHDPAIELAHVDIVRYLNNLGLGGIPRRFMKIIRLRGPLSAYFLIGKHYVIEYEDNDMPLSSCSVSFTVTCCRNIVPRHLGFSAFRSWLRDERSACETSSEILNDDFFEFGDIGTDDLWLPVEACQIVLRHLQCLDFGMPVLSVKQMLVSSLQETGNEDRPHTKALLRCLDEELTSHAHIANTLAELGNAALSQFPARTSFSNCKLTVDNSHAK